MLTEKNIKKLKANKVKIDLLTKNGLGDEYYIRPLKRIEEIGIKISCDGMRYKFICEMANDEDIAPTSDIDVVVDGILAYEYADQLERAGLDLITYFRYRFKPDKDFKKALKKFKSLISS